MRYDARRMHTSCPVHGDGLRSSIHNGPCWMLRRHAASHAVVFALFLRNCGSISLNYDEGSYFFPSLQPLFSGHFRYQTTLDLEETTWRQAVSLGGLCLGVCIWLQKMSSVFWKPKKMHVTRCKTSLYLVCGYWRGAQFTSFLRCVFKRARGATWINERKFCPGQNGIARKPWILDWIRMTKAFINQIHELAHISPSSSSRR